MAIKLDCWTARNGRVRVSILTSPPSEGPFDVDYLGSREVEESLRKELDRGRTRFIIDLNGISHMHSRAFWALVRTGAAAKRAGGKVVLVHLSPYLQHLVRSTSASDELEVQPSLEAAHRAFIDTVEQPQGVAIRAPRLAFWPAR